MPENLAGYPKIEFLNDEGLRWLLLSDPGRLLLRIALFASEPSFHFVFQQQNNLLAQEEQRTVEQNLSGKKNSEDHRSGLLPAQLQQPAERSPDKWRSHDKDIAEDLHGEHGLFEWRVYQVSDGPRLVFGQRGVIRVSTHTGING